MYSVKKGELDGIEHALGCNKVKPGADLKNKGNTSLAALGALAHRLQHLTAHLIQNGQWGLEIG